MKFVRVNGEWDLMPIEADTSGLDGHDLTVYLPNIDRATILALMGEFEEMLDKVDEENPRD